MFHAGAQNSGNKRSPPMMWEELQHSYPDRFNLPVEHEIRSEVQRLLKSQNQGRSLKNVPGRSGRKGMKPIYQLALEEFLDAELNLMPKRGL